MQKLKNSIANLPFMLCSGFLFLLGKILGLSYKQISVIFNLYFQGSVLAISGMLPLAVSLGNLFDDASCFRILIMLVCASYASIYLVAFIGMVKHYYLPMDDAFDLCVKDLQKVSRVWRISYEAVNLIIFVWWWLSLLGINCLIAYLLTIHRTE